MPAEKSPSEPSMEEIIASVSRILGEDKSGAERHVGAAAPVDAAASAERSDILELTQVVDEDGSVRRVSPWAGDAAAPARTPDGPIASQADAVGRIEPLPSHADPVLEPKFGTGSGRIVSAATLETVAATFSQLGALPRERRNETKLPLGGIERTLEEIVRETVRPLLQVWLDNHLPGIVERLVREEIARVAGEAGLR
jgi:cell pole-organizing protein PopZ